SESGHQTVSAGDAATMRFTLSQSMKRMLSSGSKKRALSPVRYEMDLRVPTRICSPSCCSMMNGWNGFWSKNGRMHVSNCDWLMIPLKGRLPARIIDEAGDRFKLEHTADGRGTVVNDKALLQFERFWMVDLQPRGIVQLEGKRLEWPPS